MRFNRPRTIAPFFGMLLVTFLLLIAVPTTSAQDGDDDDSYICLICGGGESVNPGGIIDLPGEEQTTCAALWLVAQDGGFNQTFCEEVVQPVGREDCGCINPPPYYICPICGGGEATNPEGIVDVPDGLGPTTCAAVYVFAQQGAFNETFCEEVIQPLVKEPCGCTDPPPTNPTPAPIDDSTPTPAPVDASTPTPAPVDDGPSTPTEAPDDNDSSANFVSFSKWLVLGSSLALQSIL